MLTAKDLLYKGLDYGGFWDTSKKMRDSPPSIARRAQLDALLMAFGIDKKNASAATQVPVETAENETVIMVYSTSTNPKSMNRLEYIKSLKNFEYFSSGEFLADRDRTKYEGLISQIISTIKNSFPEQSNVIDQQPLNLVQLFRELYNCRLHFTHMVNFIDRFQINDRFSIETAFTAQVRKRSIDAMSQYLTELDDLLCLLIDPDQRSFNEAEINYPSYDLAALDAAWYQERFPQRPNDIQ